MKPIIPALMVLVASLTADLCRGDTFGTGSNTFVIYFTTIGNPGNPPDTTGKPSPTGSVQYTYRIGTYEISEQMIDKANALGGLGITKQTFGPDKPATAITWFEAAKFVNWLDTSSGFMPAYRFDASGDFQLWQPADPGYDSANQFRNRFAKYVLPSVDEWYKAAYYDPVAGNYYDYPTGSDFAPLPVSSGSDPGTAVYLQGHGPADIYQAGGASPYDTVAQGGNVSEWNETVIAAAAQSSPNLSARGFRGGDFFNGASAMLSSHGSDTAPANEFGNVGFRVASVSVVSVPEPSTASSFLVGAFGTLCLTTRSLLRRDRCVPLRKSRREDALEIDFEVSRQLPRSPGFDQRQI